MEEAGLAAEDLLPVPHGPSQDAAEHVTAAVVRRVAPVRDGHGQGADVVGHHSVGHVNVVGVLFANLKQNGKGRGRGTLHLVGQTFGRRLI